MNFAIIGATGNVGRKTLEVLEKSKLKVNKLFLIASNKSVGKKIRFKRKILQTKSNLRKINIIRNTAKIIKRTTELNAINNRY